jgi:hypothetical protein
VNVVQSRDSGWCEGVLGKAQGWFPSDYVGVLSNRETEELHHIARDAIRRVCDSPEQIAAEDRRASLGRHSRLEPQDLSNGTPDRHRPAVLDSIAGTIAQNSRLTTTTQHPKPKRMKTQYDLHGRWKSDSGDSCSPTEPIHFPNDIDYSLPRHVAGHIPPLETSLLPANISVAAPVPSRPAARPEILDAMLDDHADNLLQTLRSLSGDESCALLATLLTDRECCRRLLKWRGEAAQFLINLLQSVSIPLVRMISEFNISDIIYKHLDHFPPDSKIRGLFVGVLIKLSRESTLYPECLIRDDIKFIGKYPVTAGRFGDVWKGTVSSHEAPAGHDIIAVKVLRVYQKSDVEKVLKVPVFSG